LIELVLGVAILLFIILGVPLPYIQIGKKTKKGYKYTIGIVGFLKKKIFVDDDVVERFNWYIEEFENFISGGNVLSFASICNKVLPKIKLTETEKKYILEELIKMEESFYNIERRRKLNRRDVFKDTVKEFISLIRNTSKIIKEQIKLVQERKQTKIEKELLELYSFSAKQYNDYLRHLRVFLDRTSCYHNIKITHYDLMHKYFVPEKML